MTPDEKLDALDKKLTKIKRSGDIQTVFLVLVFVFGITSITDITSKLKGK